MFGICIAMLFAQAVCLVVSFRFLHANFLNLIKLVGAVVCKCISVPFPSSYMYTGVMMFICLLIWPFGLDNTTVRLHLIALL